MNPGETDFPTQPIRPIPGALRQAHAFMQQGDYTRAAPAFEELARSAEARGGLRAPFLYIQAGRARLSLHQNTDGVANIRHGLELFASGQRFAQLYRSGNRAISELKTRGLDKDAREIASYLQAHIPAISESPTQRGPDPSKVRLPALCPACGGPLHVEDVEWISTTRAECSFCGSAVAVE